MPINQEALVDRGRWERFLSTVPHGILEATRFASAEGYALRFFLQMHFLEQEHGASLSPILKEQAGVLAARQAEWLDLPNRTRVTPEETSDVLHALQGAKEQAARMQQEQADSVNYQKAHYPQLIAAIMEGIRLRGHTPLPPEAITLLEKSGQLSMEVFGNTLVGAYTALFDRPAELPPGPLPSPVARSGEKPSSPVDAGFHWKVIGIDPSSAEYQAYNSALQRLAEKYPDSFPQAENNSRWIVLTLKTNPDFLQVLGMLQETFQKTHPRMKPEQSLARVLSLIAWNEGELVRDWRLFVPHAEAIVAGTARTLLPEPAQVTQIIPEAAVTESRAKPIRTDKFPQTDEEIRYFIQKELARIEKRIQDVGLSAEWPMNQATFEKLIKLGKNLVNESMEESKKFISPQCYSNTNKVPYFSLLTYVKLLVLQEFHNKYGMTNHRVRKIFERFNEVFDSMNRV